MKLKTYLEPKALASAVRYIKKITFTGLSRKGIHFDKAADSKRNSKQKYILAPAENKFPVPKTGIHAQVQNDKIPINKSFAKQSIPQLFTLIYSLFTALKAAAFNARSVSQS